MISGRALVAQGGGSAAILSPSLLELARVRSDAQAVRFLEAWRAVALVDERQQVSAEDVAHDVGVIRHHQFGQHRFAIQARHDDVAHDELVRLTGLIDHLQRFGAHLRVDHGRYRACRLHANDAARPRRQQVIEVHALVDDGPHVVGLVDVVKRLTHQCGLEVLNVCYLLTGA